MNWKDFSNFQISVKVAGDEEIRELNAKYKGKDEPTDVLSFEVNEKLEDGSLYLGDIIVNKSRAEEQAAEYNNTLEEEVAELVEHGVLHLLGVHHDGDDH